MPNSLECLLRLCEQLHACSDEDLQSQLSQLAGTTPERLLPSVRLLLHTSQYVRQHMVAAPVLVAIPPAPEKKPPTSPLSPREQEVLALLARGYTLPQIGDKLFISADTVNNHCARMREKLGLTGRNSLMAFAMGNKVK